MPFQTFTNMFNVGVLAFHMNGIKEVRFSANNGPSLSVTEPSLNPQNNVEEYWVRLRAGDFSDGSLEVRAVAIPVVGEPRVLPGLVLNANGGSSLPSRVRYVSISGSDTTGTGALESPFRTIRRAVLSIRAEQGGTVDGGRVLLGPGSYAIESMEYSDPAPVTTTRWLTISRNPTASQGEVIINELRRNAHNANDGLNSKLIRVHSITLHKAVSESPKAGDDMVWYDDVAFQGTGLTDLSFVTFGNKKFGTNLVIRDVQDAVVGWQMIRNASIENTGQTVVRDTKLVVNVVARNAYNGIPGTTHPDVYQFTGSNGENAICYNMVAHEDMTVPAIRIQQFGRDIAIVDSHIGTTSNYVWEMERPYRHILLRNSILDGGFVRSGTFSGKNIVFDGCEFPSDRPDVDPGILIR